MIWFFSKKESMINDWSFEIYDWNGPIESNKPDVRVMQADEAALAPFSNVAESSEEDCSEWWWVMI